MNWSVRLEDVGHRYRAGGPWVLRGVDLELSSGALLRIEGGNGSGKSTLLRLLAGIDAPAAGRLRGRPPARGYVPERFPAALPLTALGYLTHLGRVRGLSRRAAVREGAGWLERFGAERYAGTRMRELSKGSSQKVAVAQALMGRPGLLVLDEAWTGLGQPARAVLDAVVRERVAEGGAVAFADHDPARLAGTGHATVRVVDGRVAPGGAGELDGTGTPGGEGEQDGAGRGVRAALTRIEALGAPGSRMPAGLPPNAPRHLAPDGVLTLTVPAADSDTVLRTLLAARPGWHIRSLRESVPHPAPDPEDRPAPAPRPGEEGDAR
ncbi:ATP-binding cassette domain-containing protein [Streptomyces albus subsp. chlorinus]|uniref:ABC transporter ATP-binding protein n=1 Tax=Streptomyces albus TaxID=1888 RepID=UPI00156DC96B|nr:ATP-binding cassette domain-containing protein [Streptomyces albus]NSC24467.1 ATP-binding cassette domain-containing protein [Streptomyces albus subsp. chlorinus]